MPGTTKVFDSSDIPGEIIDLMVVNTATLADNPDFGKALVGAWYEVMALMAGEGEATTAALNQMATAAATDLVGYKAQLATTQMFYDPAEAVAFSESPELIKTMELVARFSFDHGLLGQGASGPEVVGVAFPGNKTFGDTTNVKLRFNADYMKMAADGAL
jgi:NitT/TauT family transport system substrate-binding protein